MTLSSDGVFADGRGGDDNIVSGRSGATVYGGGGNDTITDAAGSALIGEEIGSSAYSNTVASTVTVGAGSNTGGATAAAPGVQSASVNPRHEAPIVSSTFKIHPFGGYA